MYSGAHSSSSPAAKRVSSARDGATCSSSCKCHLVATDASTTRSSRSRSAIGAPFLFSGLVDEVGGGERGDHSLLAQRQDLPDQGLPPGELLFAWRCGGRPFSRHRR